MKLVITNDDGVNILSVSNETSYDTEDKYRENIRLVVLEAIDNLIDHGNILPEDIIVSICPHLKKRITKRNRTEKNYS